jgi:hypothetical protein
MIIGMKKEIKLEEESNGQEAITKDLKSGKKHSYLGQYLITGGPGRPKGMKNKLTLLKDKILKVCKQEEIEEIFRELCRGSKSEKLEAMKLFFSLLPREKYEEDNNNTAPKCIVVITQPKENMQTIDITQDTKNENEAV